ncbi:MAG: hypothetical protein DRI57_00515 [Deltaproteobacteria bacterium]|nr:MAG: hypothetical protein DRI57_00515 [Deltaproteobacteria bacterium]
MNGKRAVCIKYLFLLYIFYSRGNQVFPRAFRTHFPKFGLGTRNCQVMTDEYIIRMHGNAVIAEKSGWRVQISFFFSGSV